MIQAIGLTLLITFQSSAQQKTVPRFESYPVAEKFNGKPAKVKLDSPDARLYRIKLRENATNGVNFAGHFILATWGCGSDCVSLAVIDARTGKVYFDPSLESVGGFGYALGEQRVQFRRNSRLLITVGAPNDKGYVGRRYWVWKSNRFKLIRAIEDREYKDK